MISMFYSECPSSPLNSTVGETHWLKQNCSSAVARAQ